MAEIYGQSDDKMTYCGVKRCQVRFYGIMSLLYQFLENQMNSFEVMTDNLSTNQIAADLNVCGLTSKQSQGYLLYTETVWIKIINAVIVG